MDPNAVATSFVNHYYTIFDGQGKAGIQQLGGLYGPQSFMTFETTKCVGAENIVKQLSSLPWTSVKHKINTIEAQPIPGAGVSLLVVVNGALVVDDEATPMNYSQVWIINQTATGSWMIMNDLFSLSYGQ